MGPKACCWVFVSEFEEGKNKTLSERRILSQKNRGFKGMS